jgi:hypothetical protein
VTTSLSGLRETGRIDGHDCPETRRTHDGSPMPEPRHRTGRRPRGHQARSKTVGLRTARGEGTTRMTESISSAATVNIDRSARYARQLVTHLSRRYGGEWTAERGQGWDRPGKRPRDGRRRGGLPDPAAEGRRPRLAGRRRRQPPRSVLSSHQDAIKKGLEGLGPIVTCSPITGGRNFSSLENRCESVQPTEISHARRERAALGAGCWCGWPARRETSASYQRTA